MTSRTLKLKGGKVKTWGGGLLWSMTLVTELLRLSDQGIWEAFEKAVSRREVG